MPDDSLSSATAPCFLLETDIVTVTLADTRQSVLLHHAVARSWRKLADYYGLPHNVLYAVGTGKWSHVSWETVRLVRRRIGLSDPGELRQVPVCPSCGDAHVLPDCHGAPVAAVVALAPGERIARSQPEPPAWVRMAAAFLAQREAARRV
jgi:hypothetical protein